MYVCSLIGNGLVQSQAYVRWVRTGISDVACERYELFFDMPILTCVQIGGAEFSASENILLERLEAQIDDGLCGSRCAASCVDGTKTLFSAKRNKQIIMYA